MRTRVISLAIAGLVAWSAPASAQTAPDRVTGSDLLAASASPRDASAVATRPRILLPMYATFIALESGDAYLPLRGRAGGAPEINPVVATLGAHPGSFIALKAVSTLGSVWLSERMRKKHPMTAVVTMIAVNGLMASVDARNIGVARGR